MMLELKTMNCRTYIFEVVQTAPWGYEIWLIGRNMPDGYLPFCLLSDRQRWAGGRDVDVGTLKAVKVEGAQIILDAIGFGGKKTVKEMQEFIRTHRTNPGLCEQMEIQKYKAAIPYMKKIGL